MKGPDTLRVGSPLISLSAILLLLFSFLSVAMAAEPLPVGEAAKLLPERVSNFRAMGPSRALEASAFETIAPEDFNLSSSAARSYVSSKGLTVGVTLMRARSDAGAYALLTHYVAELRNKGQSPLTKMEGVGTVAFSTPERLLFFKGPALVSLTAQGSQRGQEQLVEFARSLAETIPSEENEIPALAKHLPDWEKVQEQAVYAVSLNALRQATGDEPVLEAIDFSGGTETATALYDSSRLVIIEFGTPQLAADNDERINARLKELRDAGRPVPTAYRRVGNYSVFVFGAPDEQRAGQLIDAITYEKVVQWLGDNPHAWDKLERDFNQSTSNLIVGIVKASGFSALLCLAVGGLFGGLVFLRRRSQQSLTDKYSDAGGMLRLNIDELTPQTDPTRLLGKGDN